MTSNNQFKNQHDSADDLESLLTKFALKEHSEADLVKLSALLSESEHARWSYIHAVHLGEGIKGWSQTQGVVDIWAVLNLLHESDNLQDRELASHLEELAVDDARLARGPRLSQQVRAAHRQRGVNGRNWWQTVRSWQKAGLAVAATFLLAVSFWQGFRHEGDVSTIDEEFFARNDAVIPNVEYTLSDSENVVARVTSITSDVAWTHGREPRDFLMRFRPGDVVGMEKGLLQLEFSSGASLIVESPAMLQVTSATSARLSRGRVVGRADNGNFTLLTPTANVVDIGTEFGVGVSNRGTDVTVFEGEVHVHSLLGRVEAGSMQRLQTGMSVLINPQGLSNSHSVSHQPHFQRSFDRSTRILLDENSVSLLDLIGGHDSTHTQIAGSIDPKTGYWGRPPWMDPHRTKAQRGDTQFAQTDWNSMVDGVFIPRSNAREMQIDSDGHMVYLPPNSGSTWGPIWARRRFDPIPEQALFSAAHQGYWGAGTLSQVVDRLQQTRDGLMGLHANVGITFNLDAVRESRSRELAYFKAIVANLASSPRGDDPKANSVADVRVFVDGKLRYSRLQFGSNDGDASILVELTHEDRFLTVVTTDADGDPLFDLVVLIDPVLEYEPAKPLPSHLEVFL